MHRRNEDRANGDRRVVFVLDRHLRLGVGTQPRDFPGLASVGHSLRQLVREKDGQRHQLRRLVRGKTKHDSLIACPTDVHALTDLP